MIEAFVGGHQSSLEDSEDGRNLKEKKRKWVKRARINLKKNMKKPQKRSRSILELE
jgi:hypothetical protein